MNKEENAKELEKLRKELHQKYLDSQSESGGRKLKKRIKHLEKKLGDRENWGKDYLTSMDMVRWFPSSREYAIMRKKTHKKYPSWEEIQIFKKEVGFYGKCPDCRAILQGEKSCDLCGWVYREEQKEELKRRRSIPKHVQREVWRRDLGKCVECGSKARLEFDHIIPFSKGGSNTARNIQLLCEECNRKKSNQI